MRARPGASKEMSSSLCRCLHSAHSITGPQRAKIRIDPDLASRHLSMLQATGLLQTIFGGREMTAWVQSFVVRKQNNGLGFVAH